jgi:hypothetical protein
MDTVVPVPGSLPVARLPTVQDVDAVASIDDPWIRNLRITHTYHLLSAAFSAATGPGANWCTFAVWASRQAGQTMRGEDLLQALQEALRTGPRLEGAMDRQFRRGVRLVFGRPDSRRVQLLRVLGTDAFHRAGGAVTRGNLRVFHEIAREFARFLPLCAGGRVSPEALEEFLDGLRPGAPPAGQSYLRAAFTHYARALETADLAGRAGLMLLANLEIGLHEQTRLQPEILEALEVPYTTATGLGRRMLLVLVPGSARWWGWASAPFAAALGGLGRLAVKPVRPLLRRAVTDALMTLRLPGGPLRLGRDFRGEPPEALRDPANPELRALLARFRPTPDDRDGAGADDWSELDERMRLIAKLFRCRHDDRRLFEAPFTAAQVRDFEAGAVPGGVL